MERLIAIQQELKAKKDLYNGYGGYNYRSCESILEALKPLLLKHKLAIVIQDDLLNVGERYYVKAIVRLIDVNKDIIVETTAFAREEETKKGMDGSQITGASSSYARKYALNGLFAIDDTKDSDTTNKGDNKQDKKESKQDKPFKVEEPKPMTLEEARQMGFTSNGKEYVVATMTEEQLLAMKDYTKLPKLAEACSMELAERAKAKVENGEGQNT